MIVQFVVTSPRGARIATVVPQVVTYVLTHEGTEVTLTRVRASLQDPDTMILWTEVYKPIADFQRRD